MLKKKLSIIVVEDHPLMRHGIRRMLETESDISVVFETADAEAAVAYIAENEPDIALIDIELESRATGIDLVKAITRRGFRTKTIILTMHDEKLYADKAFSSGAKGFLTKNEAPHRLIESVRTVAAGHTFTTFKPDPDDESVQKKKNIPRLSDRELEVFEYTGMGFTSGEIAEKFGVTINTIETHKKNIITKLNIKNSKELLKSAIQWVMEKKRYYLAGD